MHSSTTLSVKQLMKRTVVSIVFVSAACAGLLLAVFAGRGVAASDSADAPPVKKSTSGKSKTSAKKADADDTSSDDASDDDVQPGFRREGVSEIVLWNEHNGKHHDNGRRLATSN